MRRRRERKEKKERKEENFEGTLSCLPLAAMGEGRRRRRGEKCACVDGGAAACSRIQSAASYERRKE